MVLTPFGRIALVVFLHLIGTLCRCKTQASGFKYPVRQILRQLPNTVGFGKKYALCGFSNYGNRFGFCKLDFLIDGFFMDPTKYPGAVLVSCRGQ
jgi:hypothetical protein